MLSKQLTLCIIFSTCLFVHAGYSQCTAPASPPASTPTDPVVSDGETIGSGTTKWYKGSGTLNSLTIRGGTFIVDGNLTVSSLTIHSGEIIIRPGASLSVMDNVILQGNAKIVNYGNYYVSGHMFMMGPTTAATPNCIVNATPASTISTPANSLYIMDPNSTFINNGKAQLGWIYTSPSSSSGSIVLNEGSETNVRLIYNEKENSIVAPSGKACVSISTNSSTITKQLTNSPNVKLAFQNSDNCNSCTTSPWGDAEIFTNTPSCAAIVPLPVEMHNFKVVQQNNCNTLSWQADVGSEQVTFILERSTNSVNFQELARTSKTSINQYQLKDCSPAVGSNYYRIKLLDERTGEVTYSEILLSKNTNITSVSTYPNPFTNEFTVSYTGALTLKSSCLLRNSLGQEVTIDVHKQSNSLIIHTPENLKPGVYFFQLTTDNGTYNYRLVKK